jgi:hypothetical protein
VNALGPAREFADIGECLGNSLTSVNALEAFQIQGSETAPGHSLTSVNALELAREFADIGE